MPRCCAPCSRIVDVGLDYVSWASRVPTLSRRRGAAPEAGRFSGRGARKTPCQSRAKAWPRKGTLFLFDEPTTGLHFEDIAKLMRALSQAAGGRPFSLIVIEHNLDVIRASDWLIDLGPEGGDGGGQIVAQGTPEEVRQAAGQPYRAGAAPTTIWPWAVALQAAAAWKECQQIALCKEPASRAPAKRPSTQQCH